MKVIKATSHAYAKAYAGRLAAAREVFKV